MLPTRILRKNHLTGTSHQPQVGHNKVNSASAKSGRTMAKSAFYFCGPDFCFVATKPRKSCLGEGGMEVSTCTEWARLRAAAVSDKGRGDTTRTLGDQTVNWMKDMAEVQGAGMPARAK